MMQTPLLNEIAFDLVKDKVIQDKLEEAKNDESQTVPKKDEFKQVDFNVPGFKMKEQNEDEFPELDEPDSEEERIMQRELAKRQEMVDHYVEREKEKAKRKYGEYKDIIETEFLDTMLKNDQVVCHFYHNSFERCKIMDKHLRIIAESHPDTLFVKINAEKTPFFTAKLQIQVTYLITYLFEMKFIFLDFAHPRVIQRWKGV